MGCYKLISSSLMQLSYLCFCPHLHPLPACFSSLSLILPSFLHLSFSLPPLSLYSHSLHSLPYHLPSFMPFSLSTLFHFLFSLPPLRLPLPPSLYCIPHPPLGSRLRAMLGADGQLQQVQPSLTREAFLKMMLPDSPPEEGGRGKVSQCSL